MPARQPFTTWCQALARPRLTARADLHIHTTYSDGAYTPQEVVDLARRSGLAAVSITDHDCLEGLTAARSAAGGHLEVVPGVELSARYRRQVFHLLGYFFRMDDPALTAGLAKLRQQRAERFREMVARLRSCGVVLENAELDNPDGSETLGRRNLAQLLVKAGGAATVREAFVRYLGDNGRAAVPAVGLPVEEAIALVRGAGGVAAWAHPSYDCTQESLQELRSHGLNAVEAEYPGFRRTRIHELRRLAAVAGLAVTGGSDCHGPDNFRRAIGVSGISCSELEVLRQRAVG
jgi:predicted metal-dependent phosphoesterase TrpH